MRGTIVLLCVGLAAVLTGTFLPWMHSGHTTRNSYQAGGVARRVLPVPAWLHAALRAWPFTALAVALVAALLIVGYVGVAAACGVLLSVGSSAVAVGTLSLRGNSAVSPTALGPVITLIGAVVALASSTLLLLRQQDRTGRAA